MGGSLIIAIGAQNAFVLKQGLKKHHLFLTAITCFLCDSILIVLGVLGIGFVMEDFPYLDNLLRWGGALFLLCYGIRSFLNALKPQSLITELETSQQKSKLNTLLPLLAFTLLNPHTYIDTFLILGNVGAQAPHEEHFPFIMGALSASLVWFFGLTYGASRLSPYFKSPRVWKYLDMAIGFIMVSIAVSLIV